jgi:hypothetical protein
MNASTRIAAREVLREIKDVRRSLTTAILWIVSYFGARFLLETSELSGAARVAVALAPVPFFVAFLLAEMRLMRNFDELQRRIQLEALAFAFPALLVLMMTLGLLQLAGVALSPEDWSYRHLWAIGFGLYGAGIALAARRYR